MTLRPPWPCCHPRGQAGRSSGVEEIPHQTLRAKSQAWSLHHKASSFWISVFLPKKRGLRQCALSDSRLSQEKRAELPDGLRGEETRPRMGPEALELPLVSLSLHWVLFAHFGGARHSLGFWASGVGERQADTMDYTGGGLGGRRPRGVFPVKAQRSEKAG